MVIGPQSAVESPKKVVVAGFLMAAMQLGAAITLTLGSVFLTVMAVFWTFAFLYDWGDWRMVRLCLLYTSPSPRDRTRSRMPSSA